MNKSVYDYYVYPRSEIYKNKNDTYIFPGSPGKITYNIQNETLLYGIPKNKLFYPTKCINDERYKKNKDYDK